MPVLSRIEIKAQEKSWLVSTKTMLVKRLSRQFTSIPTDVLEPLNNLTNLQQIYEIDEQIPELETLEELQKSLDSLSQRNN